MKILIVAMSNSIHTARWVNQLTNFGWDLHLFSSTDINIIHPEMKNITMHTSFYGNRKEINKSVKIKGLPIGSHYLASIIRGVIKKFFPNYLSIHLSNIIKKINPDIIHALEIQSAGYLVMNVKKRFRNNFPKWIVTNWGSDIYLFGRIKEHKSKIEEVLKNCDYYSCECYRDINLAKLFGYRNKIMPVIPNSGGVDMNAIIKLRQPGLTSKRRLIVLKGYQNWSGRALVGLRALERCTDILKGYTLVIHSISDTDNPHSSVVIAAKLFSNSTGVPVIIVPDKSPHDRILSYHGRARISIGLSISDAISTSLLEAMVMGSFPIQSWTACADEWIKDGETGFLVPPEDPEIIEKIIRKALLNDNLVNNASEKNLLIIKNRLDSTVIREEIKNFYLSAIKKND